MFLCGAVSEGLEFPDTGGFCCYGAIMNGPQHCTCWEPVYDLRQQEPLQPGEPAVRQLACPDCAYGPSSPERQNAAGYAGDADLLDEIVWSGQRFYCHQGMRKPIQWRHPSGVVIDGHPAGYEPPIVDGVAYKANALPADICAGWAARRAHCLAELERDPDALQTV